MRTTILVVFLGAFASGQAAFGQALVEHAAAAAGGSAGGVAGKKVSDGLTTIFRKVDKQAAKAAKAQTPEKSSPNEPMLDVGPGVPKQRVAVPPPPPLRHPVPRKAAPLPVVRVVTVPAIVPQVQAPEIDPVTSRELRTVSTGMSRSAVLKLGPPAARVTMYDDGHLLEIYRYQDHELSLGTVRLTDGSVSSVQVH